jgi:uracil-DNA glycosylase
MEIVHKLTDVDFTIKANYSRSMGADWAKYLKDLLISDYMDDLAFFIQQAREEPGNKVYPKEPKDLMNAFKECLPCQLKVVIVGDEPCRDIAANGLAFGNHVISGHPTTKKTKAIEDCVNKTCYNAPNLFFDKTLEDWASQGVLMLNAALISSSKEEKRYSKIFRHFTREVIRTIETKESDIVFVFTSREQANCFRKYIDEDYHHVIVTDGISEKSEIFNEINRILMDKCKTIAIKW